MPAVNIIDPGMYTTVQDLGRRGWQRYGLPPSGAMDRALHAAANALLENDAAAATLEATGTMPVMEVDRAMTIAVAYADRHEIKEIAAGEHIELDPINVGYRAYIAFGGGIDVPEVMGSRSTYVPAALGGYVGRPLRRGDLLPLSTGAGGPTAIQRSGPQAACLPDGVVRVIPGPEADWFDAGGLNTFLTSGFAATAKSDRTGIRLEGSRLSFRTDQQMVSAGLSMGTIQVPPSGQPIIMMADHPTTGGYPRIGHVMAEDLGIIAQLKPGDQLRFREVRLPR